VAASRERLYDSPQVIEIAREPIHAIGDDRVAVAHKTHQRRRVRKLTLRVPLEATKARVAHALPDHAQFRESVMKRSMTLSHIRQ